MNRSRQILSVLRRQTITLTQSRPQLQWNSAKSGLATTTIPQTPDVVPQTPDVVPQTPDVVSRTKSRLSRNPLAIQRDAQSVARKALLTNSDASLLYPRIRADPRTETFASLRLKYSGIAPGTNLLNTITTIRG